MIVKFSAPFSVQLGVKEGRVELKEQTDLRTVLKILLQHYPLLKEAVNPDRLDESYRYALLCINEGRIMKLDEMVDDSDTIRIIPPVMGG